MTSRVVQDLLLLEFYETKCDTTLLLGSYRYVSIEKYVISNKSSYYQQLLVILACR